MTTPCQAKYTGFHSVGLTCEENLDLSRMLFAAAHCGLATLGRIIHTLLVMDSTTYALTCMIGANHPVDFAPGVQSLREQLQNKHFQDIASESAYFF